MSTRPGDSVTPRWLSDMNKVIERLVIMLKRREIHGASIVASQTAELLRTVISKGRFSTVQQLLDMIRSVGKRLIAAHPIELAIGNVVRRVMKIVRHETFTLLQRNPSKSHADVEHGSDPGYAVEMNVSLATLLDEKDLEMDLAVPMMPELRPVIIEDISLIMDEIKNVSEAIAEQASDHIHAKEVILTHGYSQAVTAFLKEAAKFRSFEVIVAESAPSYEGHRQAVELARLNIQTTVITDSAIFAMMPNVNKVIIGTHSVMPNGGILAHTGAHNIAIAAKHYHVPFVVLSGVHKLCPLYAYDQDTFNEHNAPSQVLKFENGYVEDVDVQNPAFDYIIPEFVSLFITNVGSHSPAYLYRLLAEYYHPHDYDL